MSTCPQCGEQLEATAHPCGEMSSEAPDVLELPAHLPGTDEVDAYLRREGKAARLGHTLALLAISVAAFAVAGLLSYSLESLVLLIVVLLVHETGHWVGMRLFGYRDVRMFFIPFFGAAVSGSDVPPDGYKQALVALMGPLPGIFLALGAGLYYGADISPRMLQAVLLAATINGFNLLPVLPLDGGRLFELVIFGRNRYLGVLYRLGAVVALVALGVFLEAPLLAGLGVFMLFSIGYGWRVDTQARWLKRIGDVPLQSEDGAIPRSFIETVISGSGDVPASLHKLKPFARYVRQVWERATLRPPRLGASLGLSVLYVVGVLLALVAFVPAGRESAVTSVTRDDGQVVRQQVTKMGDRILRHVELDAEGLYHGREALYGSAFVESEHPTTEGQWQHGFWNGEWKDYDIDGQLRRVTIYDAGHFVSRRERTSEGWREIGYDELDDALRDGIREHLETGPFGPGIRE